MTTANSLTASLDQTVEDTDFSGVVRLTRGADVLYERAAGIADRAHGIEMTTATRLNIASGTKGFTALTVMSLVAEGLLSLDTTARMVLGDELELIDDGVTVGHLLAHTSGIGDYLDEDTVEDVNDYIMPVPVHQLATTPDYLAVLRGHPTKFPPGERFEYCNGGYVVLALIAELATGRTFHELARERVFGPAGMARTGFPRSDQLGASDAIGIIPTDGAPGWRTNVLNLPVRGSGDGGSFSTLDDIGSLWMSLFAGKIVPLPLVDDMVRPRSDVTSESKRYGMGFWLRDDRPTVMLEGYDAGASFESAYDEASGFSYTVMSNTSEGAWPLVKLLDENLPDLADQ